ncbi:glycosyltransferase family 4 protein [Carboxydochorda subterranea]|uniref:Glycosyltransferase family 4 protein n=1 Tax=Carboxydichorda subterranea TaxID=3109565 RepID=A0ABZ1BU38_9FIRM|nr:glycosyltransferase family 4 protein [Limnochorda sp. L945t]WRP16036.1 glycosyltransferase family 4 protein [Limnochorda sp. L945t]
MRVLLVNTLYPPPTVGGAERSVRLLARGLAGAGHDVHVAAASSTPGRVTTEEEGVTVHRIPLFNAYWPFDPGRRPAHRKLAWHGLDTWNPVMARRLARIVEATRPDVVHTQNLAGFSVAAWEAVKRLGIPVVHTPRDYYLLCPRNTMYRHGRACARPCPDCRVYAWGRRRASAAVDAVVATSDFLLRLHEWLGYFPGASIREVVPNADEGPVDGPERPPLAGQDRPVRFGFLGRLEPAKGVEVLLRALHAVGVPGWEAWIAGRGSPEYLRRLQRLCPSTGVRFVGFVQPGWLLAQIDVLVVPSLWHEPFGRVVVEAYAHGVPVVAARRGALPELVEHGRTGWLFDPERPDELAALLARIVKDPSCLAPLARTAARARSRFGVATVTQAHLEIYDRLQSHDWLRPS